MLRFDLIWFDLILNKYSMCIVQLDECITTVEPVRLNFMNEFFWRHNIGAWVTFFSWNDRLTHFKLTHTYGRPGPSGINIQYVMNHWKANVLSFKSVLLIIQNINDQSKYRWSIQPKCDFQPAQLSLPLKILSKLSQN